MAESRDRFVADGAARLNRVEVERIKTDVAIEFAPRVVEASGFARVVLKLRRSREIRRRIAALRVKDSPHINWLSR